jgi:periplasmic divalent cation tolerance protein
MLIVFSTFPDESTARTICAALVADGLVACANILPPVTSIYRWQGEQKEEGEILAILKLPAEGFPALEEKLTALHPYEVPEIVAIPVAAVNAGYLEWVRVSVP